MSSASAKWAATIDDRLVPLPRQILKARDILFQAGSQGKTLLRDYNQPDDVPFSPDDDVDLSQGNVFRTVDTCDAPTAPSPHRQPKYAFVLDDAWEVTITPEQTRESLMGLFDLPEDTELYRDFESPNDEQIVAGVPVLFSKGPVFRAVIQRITVKINNTPIVFTKYRVTGLEIKQTAIAQGLSIDLGFVLYRKNPDGSLSKRINDSDVVMLRKCDEFRCIAPDDNS